MTADLGPAATPRPIPTPGDRMTAARQPGPTFATYLDRHDRDQLDARAATAEQERDDALDERDHWRRELDKLHEAYARATTEREQARAEAANLRQQLDMVRTERNKARNLAAQIVDDATRRLEVVATERDQARAELGAAQEVIATIRDAAERIDRAIAHYETQQQEQGDEERAEADQAAVQDLLDDSSKAFAEADTSSERVEVIRDLLAGWYELWPSTAVTDPHEGVAWQLASLLTAAEARASAGLGSPADRAQDERTRIEEAIEKRLREAWPNWPIDDVWLEQVAAQAAIAAVDAKRAEKAEG